MKYPKIPIFFLAAAMSTSSLVVANDDDDEEPFEEARLFFELNDTDEDLGIHGKVDGDEWKRLEIEGPDERLMMKIRVRGRLKRQGLTELFFESAEPELGDGEDQLEPEVFFNRFPEGWYEIEGVTLDGEERESEVWLSHVIPAAPADVEVNGEEAAEDCDGVLPMVSAPVTLSWAPVTEAHDELGKAPGSNLYGEHGISVIYYEVVVEIDETDFKSTAIVPSDTSSFVLPTGITDLTGETEGGKFKFEILVRTDNGQTEDDDGEPIDPNPGNKSAVESCFIVI